MRVVAITVFCALLLVACGRKSRVPAGIMQPDKMEDVLWDMIQTGEFLSGFVLYRDTNINALIESKRWYEKVYGFHHVTQEEFKRSYTWYQDHPDMMKQLLDSLSVRKDKTPATPVETQGTVPNKDSARMGADSGAQPATIIPSSAQEVRDSLRIRRKRNLQRVPDVPGQ